MPKQIVTVRLDEDLVDDLEGEAEAHGFSNRTEYIRNLLRNRNRIQENTPENTTDYAERLSAVEDRLDALEGKIAENTSRQDDATAQNTSDYAQSEGGGDRMEHPAGDDSAAGSDPDDEARALAERVAAREGWDDDGRLQARLGAAAAAVRALQERGQLGKSAAVDELGLFDEHRVTGQDAETWWRKNCRPVLQEIADYSRGVHGYVLDDDNGGVYDPTDEF